MATADGSVPVLTRDTGRAVGAAALIVGAAVLIGGFTVGVLSRAAMFLLIRLNPEADGVTTDDGFEMGRFTASGSLNLLAVGLFLGFVSGLFYLLLQPLAFGPAWFQTLSLSVGGGTVAATQVVHADGVDFRILGPLGVAVALFVAIPVLQIALLDAAANGIRRALGVPRPQWGGPIAWLARAVLAVMFVAAVASLVGDVQALR